MRHRTITVTQAGMSPSQPGVCVSVTSGMGRHTLRVARHYDRLANRFGGLGRSKPCDGDGMEFASSELAFAYAHQRGYTRVWHRKAASSQHNAWTRARH